jgi:molecular chaperone IbpA
MRTFDFSPLYKSAIGFDRLAQILDAAHRAEQSQPAYPPYNIELTGENQYRISMAVAGFDKNEVEIEVDHGVLRISGKKSADSECRQFLYRGIAGRDGERPIEYRAASRNTGVSQTSENCNNQRYRIDSSLRCGQCAAH